MILSSTWDVTTFDVFITGVRKVKQRMQARTPAKVLWFVFVLGETTTHVPFIISTRKSQIAQTELSDTTILFQGDFVLQIDISVHRQERVSFILKSIYSKNIFSKGSATTPATIVCYTDQCYSYNLLAIFKRTEKLKRLELRLGVSHRPRAKFRRESSRACRAGSLERREVTTKACKEAKKIVKTERMKEERKHERNTSFSK